MKTLVISPEDMVKSWNVIDEYLSDDLDGHPLLLNKWRIIGNIENIKYYLTAFNIKFEIQ